VRINNIRRGEVFAQKREESNLRKRRMGPKTMSLAIVSKEGFPVSSFQKREHRKKGPRFLSLRGGGGHGAFTPQGEETGGTT